MALPGRITPALAGLLAGLRPLRLAVQVNHARELDRECREALRLLSAAGVPLLGQSVLLAGVNDRAETLAELFSALSGAGVRPYRLFQPDLALGTAHFRPDPARGLELYRAAAALCRPAEAAPLHAGPARRRGKGAGGAGPAAASAWTGATCCAATARRRRATRPARAGDARLDGRPAPRYPASMSTTPKETPGFRQRGPQDRQETRQDPARHRPGGGQGRREDRRGRGRAHQDLRPPGDPEGGVPEDGRGLLPRQQGGHEPGAVRGLHAAPGAEAGRPEPGDRHSPAAGKNAAHGPVAVQRNASPTHRAAFTPWAMALATREAPVAASPQA